MFIELTEIKALLLLTSVLVSFLPLPYPQISVQSMPFLCGMALIDTINSKYNPNSLAVVSGNVVNWGKV